MKKVGWASGPDGDGDAVVSAERVKILHIF